jgi:hypothetical protein
MDKPSKNVEEIQLSHRVTCLQTFVIDQDHSGAVWGDQERMLTWRGIRARVILISEGDIDVNLGLLLGE